MDSFEPEAMQRSNWPFARRSWVTFPSIYFVVDEQRFGASFVNEAELSGGGRFI